MKTAIIIISIVCGILFAFVVLCFILAALVHKKAFGHRFTSDDRIRFYTPEQFGLTVEPLEVPMKKAMLRGAVYSYPNASKDAVFVHVHGMWSGVKAYMQDVEFFASQGYPVIALNHEGTDSSDGKSIRGLANSLRCLDYTIQYIKNSEEYKGRKIYVVGHSWGGFAALNITRYHKDLAGVIAMSPFINVPTCMKGMLKRNLWFIIPFFYIIDSFYCGKYTYASASSSLKSFMGNVVILHSENDTMVSFQYNTNVLMKKNDKIEYIINNNRFHNPHYSMDAVEKLKQFEIDMRACKTEEERNLLMKNTDFNALGALDDEVLTQAMQLLMGGNSNG